MNARRILAACAGVAAIAAACSARRDAPEGGANGGQSHGDAGTPPPEPEEPTEEEPVPDAGTLPCTNVDLGRADVPVRVSGTTAGAVDDFAPAACGDDGFLRGGPDVAYAWTVPRAGTFQFSTLGSSYFAAVDVYDGCAGAPIACSTPPDEGPGTGQGQRLTLEAGQRVVIVIDSTAAEAGGEFQLSIESVGAETSCTDGVDNDGDGLTDCADPECATGNVGCIEDGPNCGDGVDQDGDGLVDCDDPDCGPTTEGTLTGPLPLVVTGDTTGMGNDYAFTEGGEGVPNRADDVAYDFVAPEAGTYRFTSYVSETFRNGIALGIMRPVCGTEEIATQAYDVPPGVDVTLAAGEHVLVVVDPVFDDTGTNVGSAGGGGPFVLRVERAP